MGKVPAGIGTISPVHLPELQASFSPQSASDRHSAARAQRKPIV